MIVNNVKLVLDDQVVQGSLEMQDGVIRSFADGPSRLPQALDGDGGWLLPGLIELHTDNLDKFFTPRPNVDWPAHSAMSSHDALMVANGITTVLDAVAIGDVRDGGHRLENLQKMIDAVIHSQRAGVNRAEHRLHLRCELPHESTLPLFEQLMDKPGVSLVSLMDHSPGQRQFASREKYREYYQGKYHLNDQQMSEYEEQQVALSARWAAPNREAIAAYCRARRISLASHDDATAAHVAESCALGSAIAEFPTTEAAARASHQQGLQVLMGAPNIVRGGSHPATWRRTTGGAGRAGYSLFRLLPGQPAGCGVSPRGGRTQRLRSAQAVRMITRNPARALDLQDRGTIAEGLRADLVLARPHGEHVYVQNVWRRAGRCSDGAAHLPDGAFRRRQGQPAGRAAGRRRPRAAGGAPLHHPAGGRRLRESHRAERTGISAPPRQGAVRARLAGPPTALRVRDRSGSLAAAGDRRGGQRFTCPPAAGAAALWCTAAAGVPAGQRRDPAPAPAGSRTRKRRTDRAAAGAGGGISAESARRLPAAAQRRPTRRHPRGAAGAAAHPYPTSSGCDAMNDFAQPKIGDNVTLNRTRLGQYVHLADDAILEEVEMGDYSYTAGHNQIFYATIGKFVSIASYARINPGNHPTYQRIAQHHFTYRASEYGLGEDDAAFFDWRREHHVTVGHDVWIGHNAILMPGVSVGNGAVIGSAAVVTKDVEPYSIVAGVAAKKIGMRFDDALIERIERSQWWHWDHATLQARLADFRDINRFAQKYL